ncbi:uncharacterized protein LOC105183875 [Harpegnathos saltator]|uniref:uncharacterized protein LOC105183875 n=1 Tax=Harpegnathos saltator TaxID=610380 RepID=UPI00058F3333|nr:uncharacterized protein LOC105183875 [Harpegnathos saltator]
MFRLVIVLILACIFGSARCGILTPTVGKLVSEKVVESHSNNVVHASAPLLAAFRYPSVALVQPAAVLSKTSSSSAEKTIEAYGHSELHDAGALVAPLAKPLENVEQHVVLPAIAARESPYAVPVYYPAAYPQLVAAEKTVATYGHSVQHLA